MSSVIVVTGANGFVGTHVASLARVAGHRVWAVARETEPSAKLAENCDEYIAADLYATWPVPRGADAIIHLAGLAAVGPSFAEPQRYLEINSGIMTRMSEALIETGERPRIVVVSSGAVYSPGDADDVNEASPVIPSSPYAVAKILVEVLAEYYAGRGLDTVVARPFNHIGPGQSRGFIVPDLAAALSALAPGDDLAVGNLDAGRDYTDVRDVAQAYLTLALAPQHAHRTYNIASGNPHRGHEILSLVAAALGREVPHTVEDPARMRPNDPARISGDSTRIRDEFGWSPKIPWEQSIREYVANVYPPTAREPHL